jgi:hypothetical protein
VPAGSVDFDRGFDMLLTLDLAEIEVPIPNFASDQSLLGRHRSLVSVQVPLSFQAEKIVELQRHRETKFDLDDREMHSLARDLASGRGYTVLQPVQEWHRSKGSGKVMPLGKVIEKFLAAKSN